MNKYQEEGSNVQFLDSFCYHPFKIQNYNFTWKLKKKQKQGEWNPKLSRAFSIIVL